MACRSRSFCNCAASFFFAGDRDRRALLLLDLHPLLRLDRLRIGLLHALCKLSQLLRIDFRKIRLGVPQASGLRHLFAIGHEQLIQAE